MASANAARTASRASFRFTDRPSKIRVRRSIRTRSASCSATRLLPLATERFRASSFHRVKTTNGTPNSKSVSAQFTMPSPSDSAANSSPGLETLTTSTSRFSPLGQARRDASRAMRPPIFFRKEAGSSSESSSSGSSSAAMLRNHLVSLLTLVRSYVPNAYGASGQSVSKNSRSRVASTLLEEEEEEEEEDPPVPASPESTSSSPSDSAGKRIWGPRRALFAAAARLDSSPAFVLLFSSPRLSVFCAMPIMGCCMPAAAVRALAVMSTARRVSATEGSVHPSHSGKRSSASSEAASAAERRPADDTDPPPDRDDDEIPPAPGVLSSGVRSALAAPLPFAPLLLRAAAFAMAAASGGGPRWASRMTATGTCMATLGLSPTLTLSTGKLVTSCTIASWTSRRTSSADVSLPRCHWSMASRKSTFAPGATGGGAGAW